MTLHIQKVPHKYLKILKSINKILEMPIDIKKFVKNIQNILKYLKIPKIITKYTKFTKISKNSSIIPKKIS